LKIWSRGLGRRSLEMDFRHCTVSRADDGGVVICGVTRAPVTWEFRIEIEPGDAAGLANVATRRSTLSYLVTSWKRIAAHFLDKNKIQPEEGLEDRVRRAYIQVMEGAQARRKRQLRAPAAAARQRRAASRTTEESTVTTAATGREKRDER
jgi:hypothetical protein